MFDKRCDCCVDSCSWFLQDYVLSLTHMYLNNFSSLVWVCKDVTEQVTKRNHKREVKRKRSNWYLQSWLGFTDLNKTILVIPCHILLYYSLPVRLLVFYLNQIIDWSNDLTSPVFGYILGYNLCWLVFKLCLVTRVNSFDSLISVWWWFNNCWLG